MGCARADDVVVTAGDRISGRPGAFTIVRCRACGLMRTNPRPTAAAIGAYYPDDYGPYLNTRVGGGAGGGGLRRWVNRTFRTYGTHLPRLSPGRLLEIGCAAGSFLAEMRARGWAVEGLEPGRAAAAQARAAGFEVFAGSIGGMPDPPAPYDLIVGWMVLEHLHDPVGDLRRLAGWAGSDGWLVLSVPNAGSWEMKAFGSAWYDLHLPNHLWHFTPATLGALLRRGGWRIKATWYQRNLKPIACSLGYQAGDRGWNRLARALERLPIGSGPGRVAAFPAACVLARLGRSGRMTVWARPTDAAARREV